MDRFIRHYDQATGWVSGPWAESAMLFAVRIALAGIFWRSGRTKVEDGSLITVSENTLYQFADAPFNQVPVLPPEIAAHLTTYAEHGLPLLLVLGLGTRLSALALLAMTLVIQIFVFPEAWWQVHSLWVALAMNLIVGGAGRLSIDALLVRRRT